MDEELKAALIELVEVLKITNTGSSGFTEVAEDFTVLSSESEELTKITHDENEEEKKAQELQEKIKADNEQAGYEAVESLKKLGKAFLSGEDGFKKYGEGIKQAGDAAWNASKNYGLLGVAIGGISKITSELAAASFEQADNLLKANDAISKMGAVNSFSTAKLYEFAHGASLTSKEMDKLIKPIQSMQGGLTAIGNNTTQGVEKFAEMTKVTDDVRSEFQRLGMDNGERIQAQADYVAQMEKTGVLLKNIAKTEDGLRNESLKYIKNMLILSEITGKSKEELEKQQEAIANSLQFQIQQRIWEQQLNSDISNDEKEAIRREKENTTKIVQSIADTMGAQAAGEYLKQKLTGVISVRAAQIGIDYNKFIKMSKERVVEGVEFTNEYNRRMDSFSNTNMVPILLSKEFGEGTTGGTQGLKDLNKFLGRDMVAQYKTAKDKVDANAGKTGGAVVTDPAQIARNELTRLEEKAKLKVDDLVKSMNPFVGDINSFKILVIGATALLGAAATALSAISTSAALTTFLQGAKEGNTPAVKGNKLLNVLGKGLGVYMAFETGRAIGKEVIGPAIDEFIQKKTGNKDASLGTAWYDWFHPEEASGKKYTADTPLPPAKSKPPAATPPVTPPPVATPPVATPAKPTPPVATPPPVPTPPVATPPVSTPTKPTPPVATPPSVATPPVATPTPTLSSTSKNYTEDDIKQMIIRHEGIRNKPYLDSQNLWTVGIGHLIGDGKTLPDSWNRTFSNDEIMSLFEKDYVEHRHAAELISGFDKFNSGGQAAFIDLTFNMGPNWYKKFPKATQAIAVGNAAVAADEMVDSLWYTQVKSRGPEIVNLIRQGGLQKAKKGGIFSGADSGFPVELHGNELVAPLDPTSTLAKMLTSAPSEAAAMIPTSSSSDISDEIIVSMIRKCDTMISYLSDGVAIEQKILRQS